MATYIKLLLLIAFLLHHLQELWEIDGSVPVEVDLHDKLQHLVLGGVLAHGPHHAQQLLGGDGPAPVLSQYCLMYVNQTPTWTVEERDQTA